MKQIILVIGILFLFNCSSSSEKNSIPDDSMVHLVIDAGSSGTRFCPYAIKKQDKSCSIVQADTSTLCEEVHAENGLADLGPQKALQTIQLGFANLEKKYPNITSKIAKVSLTGTGGFRKKTDAENKAILDEIEKYLQSKKLVGTARVITGTEEGVYAWHAAKQFHSNNSQKLGTLEIGGATVQIVFYDAKDNEKVFSDMIGANFTFDKIKTDSRSKACSQPDGKSSQESDFVKCKDLIKDVMLNKSKIVEFTKKNLSNPSNYNFFGMGASWGSTFQKLDSSKMSNADLAKLGKTLCTTSGAELAKKYNIPEKFVSRQCYMISYQTALIESLSIDSVSNGKGESFTRGVATSANFINQCK